MSNDHSTIVRAADYSRMPPYVSQKEMTVRVFRTTPERVQMQIRNSKHYMSAALTSAEAREIARELLAAAEDADKQAAALTN